MWFMIGMLHCTAFQNNVFESIPCIKTPRYSQSKLFAEPASVLFLWFHGVEVWQFDDVGPHSRTGTATDTTEEKTRRC